MEPSIVNTAITAIASITTALIGMKIGRKNSKSMSVRQIREIQLKQVFAPMDKVLNEPNYSNCDEVVMKLRSIMWAHYEFVPPSISREIFKLLSVQKPQKSNFSDIETVVSSFYNWTRKKLGYPYDRTAINLKLMKAYERAPFVNALAIFIASILLTFYLAVFISALLTKESTINLQISAVIMVIGILGVVEAIDSEKRP